MGDIFHSSTMFNDGLNNISNLVMILQGKINKLKYSSMEMERRSADLRDLLRSPSHQLCDEQSPSTLAAVLASDFELENSDELLQEVSDNSKMCIVEDFFYQTAALVFDEMSHCLSKVFAAPQTEQNPDKMEFEHSTAAAISTIESAEMLDTIIISSESKENKTEDADFMTTNLDSQQFVIFTGDTKSETERHETLSIASMYTHLEKSGVSSTLFVEIPDSSGAYKYSPKNFVTEHMLLHFPFDPGSAAGLMLANVALVDNRYQLPISSNEFGENSMVPIIDQAFDTRSQPCNYSKDKVFEENSQRDAAAHMLYQFDHIRVAGTAIIDSYYTPLMFEGVTLVLDSSLHWCLSFNAFHAIPTTASGENPIAAIVDPSLVYAMEFEDAFNMPLFIFRAYELSTLVYHYIPKFKAVALFFLASHANDNAFRILLAVGYAAVRVKLKVNFTINVSNKIHEFLHVNPIGQDPLLDTLGSHVLERTVITCYAILQHQQSVPACLHIASPISLADLADLSGNVGLCINRNCSDIYEALFDLKFENLWDTVLHQLYSVLEAPFTAMQLVPAILLLLIHDVTSCQGTFCWSLCELSLVLGLIFNGKCYTQGEESGAFRCGLDNGVCWKDTKDCSTYSTDFNDNKNRYDHYPLVMESVRLVIQDANDIVVLHILVAFVPKGELEGEVGDAHKASHSSIMSHELHKMSNSLLLSDTILNFINHVIPKLSTLRGFGGPSEVTGRRNTLVQPFAANLSHWLVHQMHRDLVLVFNTFGQNFIWFGQNFIWWDANTGTAEQDKTMIIVLLYSNLEDKVLFEGRSIVMNMATLEDPLWSLTNYLWDPG